MTKQKTYIIEREKVDWDYFGITLLFLLALTIGIFGVIELQQIPMEFKWIDSFVFLSIGLFFILVLISIWFMFTDKKTVEGEIKLKEKK